MLGCLLLPVRLPLEIAEHGIRAAYRYDRRQRRARGRYPYRPRSYTYSPPANTPAPPSRRTVVILLALALLLLGTALITTAEGARGPVSSPTTTYTPSTSMPSTPYPIAGSTLWAPGPDGRAVSCGTNDARVRTPACDHAWHITDGNG